MNDIIENLKKNGLRIIIFVDPITQKQSITFTFFVISGLLKILAAFSKYKYLTGLNVEEINNFFLVAGGMYIGRKLTGTVENKKEE